MQLYRKAILPLGFEASAVASGIKKSGKPDLALFFSEVPAKAACFFTVNKIQAAPVILSKRHLVQAKMHQAIIVNSGNANCFTGGAGIFAAQQEAVLLAKALGVKKENILIASTGIIGRPLPMEKIKRAIPLLLKTLSKKGIDGAKKAILTTDTFTKELTLKYPVGNKTVTICGVAKGSGMIAPDLATMLVFIFTDAQVTVQALKKALKAAVDKSFNCITVDGCMSTNDTVAILANGASGNAIIDTGTNFSSFARALEIICSGLARLLVKDAEGATKFIRIRVKSAKNFIQAKKAALAIANSSLFKTAVFGENPNFGRIVSAVGASGIDVGEGRLKIKLSPLNKKEVYVDVALGLGRAEATVYTSDLTPEYVKINAEYN